MNYEEAKSQINNEAKTKEDNHMIISFGYSTRLVLPHKSAIQLIDALGKAENISTTYIDSDTKITPIPTDAYAVIPISTREYKKIKIANLLKVRLDELPDDVG